MDRWRLVQIVTISFDYIRLLYRKVPQITEIFVRNFLQMNLPYIVTGFWPVITGFSRIRLLFDTSY